MTRMLDPYAAGWDAALAAAAEKAEKYEGGFHCTSNIAVATVAARDIAKEIRAIKREGVK